MSNLAERLIEKMEVLSWPRDPRVSEKFSDAALQISKKGVFVPSVVMPCCDTCGWEEVQLHVRYNNLSTDRAEEYVEGYEDDFFTYCFGAAFFHEQSVLNSTGEIYFAFNTLDDERTQREVAEIFYEHFEACGFKVEWNGEMTTKIKITEGVLS